MILEVVQDIWWYLKLSKIIDDIWSCPKWLMIFEVVQDNCWYFWSCPRYLMIFEVVQDNWWYLKSWKTWAAWQDVPLGKVAGSQRWWSFSGRKSFFTKKRSTIGLW